MKTNKTSMIELRSRLVEVAQWGAVEGLLGWDQEVYMPPKASESRAAVLAQVSAHAHERFVAIDHDGLLTNFKKDLDAGKLKGEDAVIVRQTWRDFEQARKLPSEFVREYAALTAQSQREWAKAREKNDFKLFLPWLEKIVAAKRQEAKYFGYKVSPYDALLDTYEEGLTSAEVTKVFDELKAGLVPLVERIRTSKAKYNRKPLLAKVPIATQEKFNTYVAKLVGFDFEAGRLDTSTHPFSTAFHPTDARITTRYKENDPLDAVGSTIHEAGHAMYEQGLPAKHYGTPLARDASISVHESQSRLWENCVGKSHAFWKYVYPKLSKEMPHFKAVPFETFYGSLNAVASSLIRVEADEVTYNLHIIVRFEIEKELIEGNLKPKDVPRVWNEKMKEYFGISVPNDREGCLQDVHWSAGYFGYFPSYTLGNIYALQLFARIRRDIPDIDKQFAKGDLKPLLDWLRSHIHRYGQTYAPRELIKKATGEYPTSKYFIEYLEKKFGEIYKF